MYGVINHLGIQNVIAAFYVFPWWSIVPIVALTCVAYTINMWRWKRILDRQGMSLPFKHLFGIGYAGQAVTYITHVTYFGGGEPVRAMLLKEHFSIPMRKGVSSIAIDKIAELTITILFIFVAIIVFVYQAGLPHLNKSLTVGMLVFAFLAIAIGLLFLLGFHGTRIVGPVLRQLGLENSVGGQFLQDVEHEVVGFYNIRNPGLWEALFLSFIKSGVELVRNILAIFMLGKGVQVGAGIVAFAFFFLGYSIPVPAALGTQEAGHAFAFSLLGLSAETGAAFSLIVRIGDVLVALVGLVYLIRWSADIITFRIRRMLFPSDK